MNAVPLAWRVLLTTVVVFIAGGYVAALVNIVGQNELTDGQPGLSTRDLLLRYSGANVDVTAGEAPPSRMLEMVSTAMRGYVSSDAEFEVLVGWLRHGATRAAFTAGPEPTPHDVILANCLRCHAVDGGEEIAATAPFGPDLFEVNFQQVSEFTLTAEPGQTRVWRAPRDWRALALTTHAHLLSVPVFVVLLGGLFLWTGWPHRASRGGEWLRVVLGSAPLVFFLIDVACWWLARIPEIGWLFALTIGATGALFGATFVLQIIIVLRGLWRRRAH